MAITRQELGDVFAALIGPWQFMFFALTFLPGTLWRLLGAHDTATLASYYRLKEAWFLSFWSEWAPQIRKGNDARIRALFQGRVTEGRVCETPLAEPLGGTILEIGPGLGFWVDLIAEVASSTEKGQVKARRSGKTKIYGIEPNKGSHEALRRRIREAGAEGIYEVLPLGIEQLSLPPVGVDKSLQPRFGKESVDCIVTILCLCSIPEPEKHIKELYDLLKKGGRWYVYEHVRMKGPWPMVLYQAFVGLFWPHMVGGCQLCRQTGKSLTQVGPWARVDLAQPVEEPWHRIVPHVLGVLTK